MTDFPALYTHFQTTLLSPDRIPLAMAAVLGVSFIGVLIGPVMGNANPVIWTVMDRLLGGLGKKLDRKQRNAGDLIMRGFFLTLIGVILTFFAGRFAQQLAEKFPLLGLTETMGLCLAMTAGTVWYTLLRLHKILKTKKARPGTYYILTRSIRTDLSGNDDFTATRLGMAFTARAFDKGIVTPVFWYLLGGLPLAFIYAGIAALAWRFGRDGHTHGFGRVALGLEKMMGFIPGILAGVLMALAGLLTPTGGMTRAFIGIMRKKGRAPYAEGGMAVTAMASALNVALGGPTVDLDGRTIARVWVGPPNATAKLDSSHLRRALYISVMAHLLLLALMGGSLFATSVNFSHFLG